MSLSGQAPLNNSEADPDDPVTAALRKAGLEDILAWYENDRAARHKGYVVLTKQEQPTMTKDMCMDACIPATGDAAAAKKVANSGASSTDQGTGNYNSEAMKNKVDMTPVKHGTGNYNSERGGR